MNLKKIMFLNFNIRSKIILLLLFFVTPALFSQEDKEEQNSTHDKEERMMILFGVVQVFPFGENIAKEAYDFSVGGEHRIWVRVFDEIWVGSEISIMAADVEKQELTGNYNNTTVFTLGPTVGYKFHLNENFELLAGTGVSYVKYKNHHPDYNFHDDGTAFWLITNLNYEITNHFGLYFSGKFRHDFLKTKATGLEEHYFDSNYLILSLGILIKV